MAWPSIIDIENDIQRRTRPRQADPFEGAVRLDGAGELPGRMIRGPLPDASTLEIPSVLKPGGGPDRSTLEIPRAYGGDLATRITRAGDPGAGGGLATSLTSADYSGGGGSLAEAIKMTESGGRNVRGKKGEYGPMQVTPELARRMGVPESALNDPNVSTQVGHRFLSHLMTKYQGDLGKVIAAYNAGEGAVDRGQIPASTQQYVQKVMRNMGGAVNNVRGQGIAFPPSSAAGVAGVRPWDTAAGPAPAGAPAAAPSDPYAKAVQQAAQQYPWIARMGVPINLTQKDGPYQSETYMPKDEANPKPGAFTVELRDKKLRANPSQWPGTIAAESIDYLARNDPTYQKVAQLFRQSMTPQQLETSRRRWLAGQKYDPTEKGRPFEDFMQGAELQEYMRGYLLPKEIPGWTGPKGEGHYTPQQTQLLDQYKQYLNTGQLTPAAPTPQPLLRQGMEAIGGGISKMLGETPAQAGEMPSPEQIKADIAKRATTPSPTDIEADIKRRAAGPPESKAAPVPWPVQAAGWAPTATSLAGQYGGDVVGAPFAVGATAAAGPAAGLATEMGFAGGGAGLGYIPGQLLNRGVRAAYGYPNIPWRQEPGNIGEQAAYGAASVPFAKGAIKILEHIPLRPLALKAGQITKAAFEQAGEAMETLTKTLEEKFGLNKDMAERIGKSPAGRKLVSNVINKARQEAIDAFSALYEQLLKARGHYRIINQHLLDDFAMEANKFPELKSIYKKLPDLIDYTPRKAQEIRTMLRGALRGLNPNEQRPLIESINKLIGSATQDMKRVIGSKAASVLTDLDEKYGNLMAQYSGPLTKAVRKAANAPEAIQRIVRAKASQITQLMSDIDKMVPTEKALAIKRLRSGVTSYIYDAARDVTGQAAKLSTMAKAIQKVPEDLFRPLYNMSREEMTGLINKTLEHAKYLDDKTVQDAIRREMAALPSQARKWIERGLMFGEPLWGLWGLVAHGGSVMHGVETIAGPTAVAMFEGLSRIANSGPAREIYIKTLSSRVPRQIVYGLAALGAALYASSRMPQPSNQPIQPAQPAAAPSAP